MAADLCKNLILVLRVGIFGIGAERPLDRMRRSRQQAINHSSIENMQLMSMSFTSVKSNFRISSRDLSQSGEFVFNFGDSFTASFGIVPRCNHLLVYVNKVLDDRQHTDCVAVELRRPQRISIYLTEYCFLTHSCCQSYLSCVLCWYVCNDQ